MLVQKDAGTPVALPGWEVCTNTLLDRRSQTSIVLPTGLTACADGSELILMQRELTECAEIYFDPSLVRLSICFDRFCVENRCLLEPFATTRDNVQIGKPVDGLVEIVRQCVQRCAIDNRKALFQNVCLIGA